MNRDPIAKEAMTAGWRTLRFAEKVDTGIAAPGDEYASEK